MVMMVMKVGEVILFLSGTFPPSASSTETRLSSPPRSGIQFSQIIKFLETQTFSWLDREVVVVGPMTQVHPFEG